MKKSEMNIELAVRYITGSASDEERNSFELWLNETKDRRDQFESFRTYWEITGSSYDNYDPDINKGWKKVSRETVHKKVETFRQKSVSLRLLRIAAIFVLLLAGGYGVLFMMNRLGLPESQLFAYSSKEGTKKYILRDGSEVWLNSNSTISIRNDFNIKNRTISLDGEAYFEIAPDKDLPFIISAGGTFTEVVGTSFNIKANHTDKNIRVTVFSGKVTFYVAGENNSSKHLLAGDRGVYNTESRQIWKEVKFNSTNDLAWKTGRILFKDASLSEVCEVISDFYKVKVLADPQIAEIKNFTGSFQQASLDEVLEIIELTLDIDFVKKGNRIVAKP
jgi:ferric-dicitrate binding protein FerR (iron transport regulator)